MAPLTLVIGNNDSSGSMPPWLALRIPLCRTPHATFRLAAESCGVYRY
jgi:hypothetical protein